VAAKDDYLVDLLVDMGQVKEEQLGPLRQEADANSEGLLDLLLSRKIVTPADVGQAKASHFGYEFVNLARCASPTTSSPPSRGTWPSATGPCQFPSMTITVAVAVADPSDLDAIDSLQRLVAAEVELRVATDEDIDAALNRYYGAADDSVGKMIQDITEGEVEVAMHKTDVSDDGAHGGCRRPDHQAGQHPHRRSR
jgi:type IV pilus assembly protein PilB